MRLSKKERERILKQVCGVVNEDDAIDPRHYFYNKRKSGNKHRKAFQLCRQVADTLQLVLTDGDPELDGLTIVDVIPAPRFATDVGDPWIAGQPGGIGHADRRDHEATSGPCAAVADRDRSFNQST